MLGLAVSVGGLAGPVIGTLADATSLRTALAPLILMPALCWLLFRALPEPTTPQHEAAPDSETADANVPHSPAQQSGVRPNTGSSLQWAVVLCGSADLPVRRFLSSGLRVS